MPELKKEALYYASLGLRVFPLQEKEKKPLPKSHGVKDATTDAEQVAARWDRLPSANIGIATGNGLLVIDLDRKTGVDGVQSLLDWEKSSGHVLPRETWSASTGSGGVHLFYRIEEQQKNRANLLPGVDVRGDGGYIVAPPSTHPTGGLYEWINPPDSCALAKADEAVKAFLQIKTQTDTRNDSTGQNGTHENAIPEGRRNDSLHKLASSLVARGADESTVRLAVHNENKNKCRPPLPDQEVDTIVNSALRYENGTAAYYPKPVEISDLTSAAEKEPEWLIPGYIPKYSITCLIGDGGSGKTSIWCNLAAAISSGRPSILEPFPDNTQREPQRVLCLSAEDSFTYTLRRRMRLSGADFHNVFGVDMSNDLLREMKYDSEVLETCLEKYRPGLVIFDPLQGFLPEGKKIIARNDIRDSLSPLVGYGEKYGTTFLLVVHTNKQSGVWGRKRMADSADIWDIARSALVVGEATDGLRYLSHEKSNYGRLQTSILYTIDENGVRFNSTSRLKDRDFITAQQQDAKTRPAREEAKDFILTFLAGKSSALVSDLNDAANIEGISAGTLQRAKTELKREGLTYTWSEGYGEEKVWKITAQNLCTDSSSLTST